MEQFDGRGGVVREPTQCDAVMEVRGVIHFSAQIVHKVGVAGERKRANGEKS